MIRQKALNIFQAMLDSYNDVGIRNIALGRLEALVVLFQSEYLTIGTIINARGLDPISPLKE
jgi:hypothetical protein